MSVLSSKFANSVLPTSSLDVEILNHFVIGNGDMFDEHIFSIDVHYEQISYTVQRSYVDFVYLHSQLRKIFPECDIPSLPLNATMKIQKLLKEDALSPEERRPSKSQIIRENNRQISRDTNRLSFTSQRSIQSIHSLQYLGDITSPERKKELPMKNADKAEDFSEKVKELQLYVRALLTFHEIVASDIFAKFLDEEVSSPALDAPVKPISTEQDLLLMNTPPITVSVRNIDTVEVYVKAGQLVVWKFSTENYDIGFSVEFEREPMVSYTRYKANEVPICGTLEVTRHGLCLLKWDNTYAKCKYCLN
jgi:hypothetical protein